MADFRNQVLILEDDVTLREAMAATFTRGGLTVHATSKPEEALSWIQTKPIGTVFVDCLMPEQGGVDFVEMIRPNFPPEILEVILMSGVFVDPAFIKDTLRTTQARHFLKKPFSLEEILNLVDSSAATDSSAPVSAVVGRKTLYSFLAKSKVTAREKKKVIEALDQIHGFDLPFVYNLLVESKTSGHLNLASQGGDIFGITFAQGHIVSVDIPDKSTFMGKLLLDGGFVSPEDLEHTLKEAGDRKLGEKLIQSYAVSPHALMQVLARQMNLRLSKTIVDQNLSLNFVQADVDLTMPNISPEVFYTYLHDWIVSKISLDWLRAHFLQWQESVFVTSDYFTPDHPGLQAPLVVALPNLLGELSSGASLGTIMDGQKFAEEPLMKAIHFLITRGLFALSAPAASESAKDRFKLLRKLAKQLSGKNPVDIYDIATQIVVGDANDPKSVAKDFDRMLGPRPSPKEPELLVAYDEVKRLTQKAFDLAASGDRQKMREMIVKEEGERRMRASLLFDEACAHLQKGTFVAARDLLVNVKKLDPKLNRLRLHMCWAQAGLAETSGNKLRALQEVEMEMIQIPPEEKMEATFHFVNGLIAKGRGDVDLARRNFEKAIAIDSQLIAAKREMSMLGVKVVKENVFDKDLKEVFSSIFRRKTG